MTDLRIPGRALCLSACTAAVLAIAPITSPSAADAPGATASARVGFQDASKNIRCAQTGSSVTCVIRRQGKKGSCTRAFQASGRVARRGASVLNAGCFAKMPFKVSRYTTLKTGKRKTIKGVTCRAGKGTMRCTNADQHGFELKRSGTTAF